MNPLDDASAVCEERSEGPSDLSAGTRFLYQDEEIGMMYFPSSAERTDVLLEPWWCIGR